MKGLKIAAIVLLAYVGIVVVFESFLGVFQPSNESTIVITTIGADGAEQDRVVTPVRDGGRLYVSANHWPRSWYKRARENPQVYVTIDGEKKPYRATPVPEAEQERLATDHAHGLPFRILTGFAPRDFLLLDPQ
jgi:hypothetical protein